MGVFSTLIAMPLLLSGFSRFLFGKLGERPLRFCLRPDPALLVKLPRARQLDLVCGIGSGILIADV